MATRSSIVAGEATDIAVELSPEHRLRTAVAEFTKEADRPADRHEALHDMIVAMHGVCGALTNAAASGVPDSHIHDLASGARQTAALSPFLARLQNRPRGYPGDFETIEYIMSQTVRAAPQTAGYWIELHSLTSGIVQQHRNKVAAQGRCIVNAVRTAWSGARILVLAAGSSPDVAEALPLLERAHASITLVDSDPDAIAFSRERLKSLGDRLVTISENVLKAESILKELGPFDLVVAGGLFDYLPSKYAKSLIRLALDDLLRYDGTFFFTNMVTPNPYHGWMRHVANWRVLERTPDECRQLVETSCTSEVRCDVSFDGTGLALLVSCTKVPPKTT